MKKLFLLMLPVMAAFTLASCDKDDDNNGTQTQKWERLVKTVKEEVANTNGEIMDDQTETETYSYDAEQRIVKYERLNLAHDYLITVSYEYDGNEIRETYDEGDNNGADIYTLNDDGYPYIIEQSESCLCQNSKTAQTV